MGFSERLDSFRTLAQRIDDLGALTAELGVTGPVVTVAHDWGGPISLGWALAHRNQVRGIVLTNTAVHQPSDSAAPALIRLARSPVLRDTVCVRTPAFVRATTALSRPSLAAAVRAAFAAPYASRARRLAVGDFVADIPLEPDHPSSETLQHIREGVGELHDVPALLLWGPRDPVFSDRHLRDLLARLPHADVHRYEGAGHLVTEDAPQSAGAIARWVLDRVGSPGQAPSNLAPGAGSAAAQRDRTVALGIGVGGAREDQGRPSWAALMDRADDPAPAIVELGRSARRVSFRKLNRRVDDLAVGLAAAGVQPGHRVALLVPPGAELAATLYACWRAGAVVVIADAGLGARSLGRALRGAGPDHVVGISRGLAAAVALRVPGRRIAVGPVSAAERRLLRIAYTVDELALLGRAGLPPVRHQDQDSLVGGRQGSDAPLLRLDHGRTGGEVLGQAVAAHAAPGLVPDVAAPAAPDPEAECAVLFTSGATGPSKGVVYRNRQVSAQLAALRHTYGITRDDRLVAAFAPFALYGPMLGITSVVPDVDVTAPAELTARLLADAVAAIDATLVFASPGALRNVVETAAVLRPEHREALAGVRLVMSAGAPVPVGLLERVQALLPTASLHTPYGMTEALPVADIALEEITALGGGNGVCVGSAVAGVDIAISPLTPDGVAPGPPIVEPDVTGEVCVRAAHVKERYDRLWSTERDSAREAGWHRTSDVGHLDRGGRLWVEGRLAHIVVTAAGVVTPVGVEQRVEQVPGVRSAAVVGVGPRGTQQLVVVVVASEPSAGSGPLAGDNLAATVRAASGHDVTAVLATPALPVDIRHQSKIDRARVAAWAGRVLSGRRVGAEP